MANAVLIPETRKQSWEYNNAGISSTTLENIPKNQGFPRN